MDSNDHMDQKRSINRTGMLRRRPPKVERERRSRSPTMEADNGTIMSGNKMIRLRPDDSDGIMSYLKDRLELLQQQALKRLAKAWIKAICPKKQARFPYKSKHQDDDPNCQQKIPEWWPPLHECEYLEPDHIDKQGMSQQASALTVSLTMKSSYLSLPAHLTTSANPRPSRCMERPSHQHAKQRHASSYVDSLSRGSNDWDDFRRSWQESRAGRKTEAKAKGAETDVLRCCC